MTVEQMSVEVWEQLGEPSDLVPGTLDANGDLTYDSSADGAVKILKWINMSVGRILSWKHGRGGIVRFRDLDERVFFQGFEVTGTAQGGSDSTLQLESGSSLVDDYYNGMVVTIDGGTGDGQGRLITDYVGSTLNVTVANDWDTTPDATSEYSINKAFYLFKESTDAGAGDNIVVDSKSKILTVTKVKDVTDETELTYREKTESYVGSADEIGTPSSWWLEGNGIRFDVAPEDDRWYECNVRVLPEDVSTGTDVVQIPETFHTAVILWCVWWGKLRDADYTAAYATHRNLETYMSTVISETDLKYEEMDGHAEVYGYGVGYY